MTIVPGVRGPLAVCLVALAAACRPSRTEVPSSESIVPVNGTELYVKRMGAGDPIVIVHGGPMLEHGYLLPHLAPLAASHELIFFDQRLSGRSAPEVDSSSVRLATYVDDIEALRQALELNEIHLMAHSWGGLLAMHYALRYQEHLRSLMLLSPMSASSALWQEEERVLAQRLTEQDSIDRGNIMESEAFTRQDPDAIRQLLLLSYALQFHDRDATDALELYVPEDYAERGRQFSYMMQDLMDYDIHDQLRSVTVPTLILYGSDEPGAALGGPALRQRLQRSQFRVIGDAGHFSFIEQKAEFLRVIRAFLKASG